MSAMTSGKSPPDSTSAVRRFLAVIAVYAVCAVLLLWAGFSDGMTAWAGDYAKPHPPTRLVPWTVLAIGIALAIHAVYAYRRWWVPEATLQGLVAIVAVAVGFGTMSSTNDGVTPQQRQQVPVTQRSTGSGNYCYSGGTCYINGVPVSGHP